MTEPQMSRATPRDVLERACAVIAKPTRANRVATAAWLAAWLIRRSVPSMILAPPSDCPTLNTLVRRLLGPHGTERPPAAPLLVMNADWHGASTVEVYLHDPLYVLAPVPSLGLKAGDFVHVRDIDYAAQGAKVTVATSGGEVTCVLPSDARDALPLAVGYAVPASLPVRGQHGVLIMVDDGAYPLVLSAPARAHEWMDSAAGTVVVSDSYSRLERGAYETLTTGSYRPWEHSLFGWKPYPEDEIDWALEQAANLAFCRRRGGDGPDDIPVEQARQLLSQASGSPPGMAALCSWLSSVSPFRTFGR